MIAIIDWSLGVLLCKRWAVWIFEILCSTWYKRLSFEMSRSLPDFVADYRFYTLYHMIEGYESVSSGLQGETTGVLKHTERR